MEYVSTCHIEDVGNFEYYMLMTDKKDSEISTYGIAIKNVLSGQLKEIYDIWHDKNKILEFINILCRNQVTLIHFEQIVEEFVEDLYSF